VRGDEVDRQLQQNSSRILTTASSASGPAPVVYSNTISGIVVVVLELENSA
jgi:hypothetical protein